MFTDEYFMKLALQEAQKAILEGEVPVGAVVVCQAPNITKPLIIAKSYNRTEGLNDVTAHAEIQAITAAANFLGGKYLHYCTMYITLEPCIMCAGALYWSQIHRIVFGASDPNRGFSNYSVPLHPKTIINKGILEEDCSNILLSFFQNKRNKR